jgi:YidC/Oxa1 family membrane protein insertase
MFQTIFIQPVQTALVWLYLLTGNLGVAIILLTLFIRLLIFPITRPSMKATQKMRDIQPELDAIKKKHKDDKVAQQQAQLELFKKHQINPASGCLPQIIQFVLLIALYQVFIDFFKNPNSAITNTMFLGIDLAQTGNNYALAVIAVVTQLVLGLMLLPATSTAAEKTLSLSTPSKKDDKEAGDMTSMAASMQKQMLFVMPLMTGFLALRFPAGLVLYWIVSTIASIGFQYNVTGWGGVQPYLDKIRSRA